MGDPTKGGYGLSDRVKFAPRDGGYSVTGEFLRRMGKTLALFNGIDPAQYPPPAQGIDHAIGFQASVQDLSLPPFRTLGRGWRIGGLQVAVATDHAEVVLQSDPTKNTIVVLDEFRFSLGAAGTLVYGWDNVVVPAGGSLTETENGPIGLNTNGVTAPKPSGVLAGHGTVLGAGSVITILGAESYAAGASTIPIPLGDVVLFPGMTWTFAVTAINIALNYSMRGRFFVLPSTIPAVPGFGAG